MSDFTVRNDPHARKAFVWQRIKARTRGIAWEFSFDQWCAVWQASGRWTEKGTRCAGAYVMARFGDVGPYAPWNVKIITTSQNIAESKRCKLSDEQVREIRRGLLEGTSGKLLARLNGVTPAAISRLKHGRTHTSKGRG